ncbi:MAG: hypothetical protein JOZ54_03450 [Acidobacteria bacterium]|nr:hypothetical protein [Acidobacteriota bacterium]
MERDLTPAQRALAERMSEISEETYCAGWMMDLELDLWSLVLAGEGTYGGYSLTREEVAELRALSDACGGWIVFDDTTWETWVPLDEWQRRFSAR